MRLLCYGLCALMVAERAGRGGGRGRKGIREGVVGLLERILERHTPNLAPMRMLLQSAVHLGGQGGC